MNLPEDWSTGTVRSNGVELRYYRGGDGPPVVMAHGFYDNGRCLIPVAEAFADDYEVVTYDARAHGRSAAPESGYGVDDRGADLVGLVDALGIEDPVVFGHSMGGSTAAWAAAETGVARALVLEDPAGMYGDPDLSPDELAEVVREKLRERQDRTVEEEIEENYAHLGPGWARRMAVADEELRPQIAEIPRQGYPPLGEVFRRVECPTLVLNSDADVERRVTDLDTAAELEDGRLVHVPDAGHYVFQDRFEAARAELRAFLEWVETRSEG